jgi:hypothetical protein
MDETRWQRLARPGWRSTALALVIATLLGAAFPRLLYWSRFDTRLGPRGLLVYAVAGALLRFGLGEWVHRLKAWDARIVAELRAELGREPTPAEIDERRVRDMLRDAYEREPTAEEVRRVMDRRVTRLSAPR